MLDNGKTADDKKYVAFAVAATKENRTVTSTYDVTIQSTTNSITEAIEIDTRSTIKSSIEEEGTLKEWNGYKGQTPSIITATPNNEDCYPVVDGEAFTIKVASKADAVALAYMSAENVGHQLRAVAESEYRNAHLKQFLAACSSTFLINAVRTSG